MCPLLAPASKGKLLLFFSFFVAAAIDSTTEANKAPLSSLYSLDVYVYTPHLRLLLIKVVQKLLKKVLSGACAIKTTQE